ncbi:hypothetical protein GYN12_06935 [Lactococcus piscium]|uniref:hypothetical protein n=1 Tax=Lactobacillales TaxID=186826 RepID=UPI0015DC7679|nr:MULTISPECIES: hypothetical protein [Lactobacillales]MCJ1972448.1 hypothetical protein [Lactococcus carnosus]MCJ1975707.1 hypothetical protein [Lactococcus carnosus]MCJ1985952.1 hypothetical protein [Lactococcus carnosus]MCJ1987098.1 hypothetical protein [Lactococcus carnosus]MCJ2004199.1 hypothetical protein [Lactococcus carnosus]
MANANEKQIAFYMTKRSAEELDEIQKIFAEQEGRVTKAYVLNQAIYHYYEYIKDFYGLSDENDTEEKN